jgi:hypothetical protein
MTRGGRSSVVVVAVLVVLGGGLVAPVLAQSAAVTVSDQSVDMTAEVVVDAAALPEGGFLALYRGDDRSGELIGHTNYLQQGDYQDIAIPFDDPFYFAEDATHIVVLYRDLDGDRSFEESGAAASDTFVIESIVTPESAPATDSPTASPDADDRPETGETATAAATDPPVENRLTSDSGQPAPGSPLWLVPVLLLVVGVVGYAYRNGDDSGGGSETTRDASGGSPATGGSSASTVAGTASDDRAQVERLLESNGGRMKQANVVSETGWSNAKVAHVLDSMADESRVETLRIGRENLITLPEAGSADDLASSDGTPSEPPTTGMAEEADDGPAGTDTDTDDGRRDGVGSGPGAGTDASTGTWRDSVPASIADGPDIAVAYDDLEFGEFVGGGGSADVHRATVETADGSVPLAVKRPRARGTLHTEQVERFVEEAETWAKLDDHDGVVDVVGWGSAPLPWLAMELMDGGHLGERAGDVGLAEGLWTAVSVAQAVRHAHRRGVAHLDLKPENVLYRETAEGWDAPKVADWGLSKQLLDHSASVDGMTPAYAAPEQFDDDYGTADDITDVYGLGAVCYELFIGQPPFEGRPSEVMNAVLNGTPTPPSEHDPSLPAALDDVLLTALASEKADRYESVLYLRDDLQELLDGC